MRGCDEGEGGLMTTFEGPQGQRRPISLPLKRRERGASAAGLNMEALLFAAR